MNLTWLQSAMMGLASGFSGPLPLSPAASRGLMRQFFGTEAEGPLFLLLCHAAVLAVMLTAGSLDLGRLRRTRRLLKTPPKRRTSHPDLNSAGTLKLLRSAGILAVVGRMLSVHFAPAADRLYLLVPMLAATGLLIWLPGHFRTANKDGRHLSAADGLLFGLAALAGAVPGISLVGAVLAMASIRGTQRQYAVRFSWLLLTLNLTTAVVTDLLLFIRSGASFAVPALLLAGIGGAAAALGSWLAIHLIRSRTRPGANGINGFCFYNWGMALLCLVLFLLV